MNKHSILLATFLVVLIAFLSSCNTTQTFTVRGVPGTVISKGNKQIAVIDQTGQAQVTTNRDDGYEQFYLAKTPNSNLQVPFALDYNDVNRSGKNRVWSTFWILPPFTFIGLCGPFFVYEERQGIKYDYDYLINQSTNNDLIR